MPDSEPTLEVFAQLGVQLGRVADGLEAAERYRVRCRGALQQVPIFSPVLAGSGTIDQPDALECKTGFHWGIRRLAAVGFTAGTVTVFNSAAGGEVIVPFDQAGVATFGRGEVLLQPGDRLVAVASGITGTVQLTGRADCFETWYLAEYIG